MICGVCSANDFSLFGHQHDFHRGPLEVLCASIAKFLVGRKNKKIKLGRGEIYSAGISMSPVTDRSEGLTAAASVRSSINEYASCFDILLSISFLDFLNLGSNLGD